MHEIERKFLVTRPLDQFIKDAICQTRIEQAYLPQTGDWTVRVRKLNFQLGGFACVQTMKRKVTDRKCVELEHEIELAHYEKVRTLCGPTIVKTRTSLRHGHHVWEIDEFPQFNGLIVAEIELKDEDEHFDIPDWLGKEVTDKKRYRNRQMAIILEELTR